MSQTVVRQETTNAFIIIDTDEKIVEVHDKYKNIQLFYLDDAFRKDLSNALIQSADYARPEVEERDIIQARMDVQKLIRKYGMGKAQLIIQTLALENVRLVREINEHRAARGIAPLETFEV